MKLLITLLLLLQISTCPNVDVRKEGALRASDPTELSQTTLDFLKAFILKDDKSEIKKYLSQSQFGCSNTGEEEHDFTDREKLLQGLHNLSVILSENGLDRSKLSNAIDSAALTDAREFMLVKHSNEPLFNLYKIDHSVDKICGNSKVDQKFLGASKKPLYLALFKLKSERIEASFKVIWAKHNGEWKVISFGIETP